MPSFVSCIANQRDRELNCNYHRFSVLYHIHTRRNPTIESVVEAFGFQIPDEPPEPKFFRAAYRRPKVLDERLRVREFRAFEGRRDAAAAHCHSRDTLNGDELINEIDAEECAAMIESNS